MEFHPNSCDFWAAEFNACPKKAFTHYKWVDENGIPTYFSRCQGHPWLGGDPNVFEVTDFDEWDVAVIMNS